MYHIDFKNPTKVHFIGIGGISMSGLACMLHNKGFAVTGSDSKRSKLTEELREAGMDVFYGHRASNVTDGLSCAIYTAAVRPDNPEWQEADRRGIPLVDRAELLGQLMETYRDAICVSGTHGKTTVTSIVSTILLEAGHDISVNLGGILKGIGSNYRVGSSDYFVVEACEYTNSFLKFHPRHGIILNMEEDHLDFFHDIAHIRESFRAFAKLVPEGGTLVVNAEIPRIEEIIDGLPCRVVTYGVDLTGACIVQPDYLATSISFDGSGFGRFDLYKGCRFVTHIELSIPGRHNVSNAVAAIALADTLMVPIEVIKRALRSFTGTKRRFEKKGEVHGVVIIDDYAHHPTEIKATLAAARNIPHKRLWCVFQPHTYSRTKALLPDMARALSFADHVILTDIYASREANDFSISSSNILDKLTELGVNAVYFQGFGEVEKFILENCTNGDMLITMGAGDVYMIGDSLLGF